jgi:hypothetical protein
MTVRIAWDARHSANIVLAAFSHPASSSTWSDRRYRAAHAIAVIKESRAGATALKRLEIG